MPHMLSLQLLSTAQKGAETRAGCDMGQLCLPTVPDCSSASNLPAEPGKAGEDQAETVFQSCKGDSFTRFLSNSEASKLGCTAT